MYSHKPTSHTILLPLTVFVFVASAIASLSLVASHAHRFKGQERITSPAGPSYASNANEKAPTMAREAYGNLPLSFESNEGQANPRVRFISRGAGHALFLTADSAVLSLRKTTSEHNQSQHPTSADTANSGIAAAVSMRLKGTSSSTRITGVDELPGKVNYLVGNQPDGWRVNVPTYEKVRYENIYQNVNLIYYGNQRQFALS